MNQEQPVKWGSPLMYRVIYGDTDRAGVVYYANYLRLFEMGRTEWMRHMLGIPYRQLEDSGVLFPVVEAYLRYKSPAGYDDFLEIRTALEGASPVALTFRYEVKKDDRLLVTGSTKHAAADSNGRLIRIPKRLSDALSAL